MKELFKPQNLFYYINYFDADYVENRRVGIFNFTTNGDDGGD